MTTPRTQFQITRDINGYLAYGLAFSDTTYRVTLSANAEQTFVLPNTYENWVVVFSYSVGNNVLVANGLTAITTTPGTFTASTIQLNPPVRQVLGGSTLRFFTADTGGALVYASLYTLPAYK